MKEAFGPADNIADGKMYLRLAADIREQITAELGVKPIFINSALVSAQSRQRLYWTNIPGVEQPEDRGLVLRDILESGLPLREKGYILKANYANSNAANALDSKHFPATMAAEPIRVGAIESSTGSEGQGHRVYSADGKSKTLCGNGGGAGAKTGLYTVPTGMAWRGHANADNPSSFEARPDQKANAVIVGHQSRLVIETADGRSFPAYKVKNGRIAIKGREYPIRLADGFYIIRKLTVLECMRLQTVPEPTIVKLTKQLEDKGLIEKVRQGQGKPTRIYIKDFSSAPHHEPEKPGSKDRELSEVKNLNFRGSGDLTPEGKDSGKSDDFTSKNEDPEPSEVKDVNFLKLNSLTSGSKDSLLPEVKNLNSIYTENIKTENNNLPSNPPAANPEGGVDGIMENVREQIEYDVLAQEYGQELCDEVVEIITEVRCRDSPRMKIGTAWYPMDFVRQRMESLTSDHVSYVLDSLGRAGPVRNPHGYLLALLFNAPASSNTAVQALYNAYNG